MRKLSALFASILCFGIAINISAAIPEKAIPFIFDGHLYLQATVSDSVPLSIIYDTGADHLYLDKDYMRLSDFSKLPFKKGLARMGGAGNDGTQTIPIILDTLSLKMGSVDYKETITPIINLREILGRYTDGIIGNNAMFDRPLLINYSGGYLLPYDTLSPELFDGFTQLPAQFKDNRIDIECELKIDSTQVIKRPFRLDLGSGDTVSLTNGTLKELDLTDKPQAVLYYSNYGFGGDGTDVIFGSESFKFLDTLENVVISASYNTQGAMSDRSYAGLISNGILCHYDLIIDAPNKALYARRNDSDDSSYQSSSRLQMGYIDRTDITDGWIISCMYKDGIAEQAGLEINELILSINGRPVKEISWEEQREGLALSGPTTFTVRKKDGSTVTYTLNIDKEILCD